MPACNGHPGCESTREHSSAPLAGELGHAPRCAWRALQGLVLHNRIHRACTARALYNKPVRPLTLFGLFAVTAMLVFYALESRRPIYVLGFAGGCALASVYGFLQGAWPFGVVEAIWVVVAIRRWRTRLPRPGG